MTREKHCEAGGTLVLAAESTGDEDLHRSRSHRSSLRSYAGRSECMKSSPRGCAASKLVGPASPWGLGGGAVVVKGSHHALRCPTQARRAQGKKNVVVKRGQDGKRVCIVGFRDGKGGCDGRSRARSGWFGGASDISVLLDNASSRDARRQKRGLSGPCVKQRWKKTARAGHSDRDRMEEKDRMDEGRAK